MTLVTSTQRLLARNAAEHGAAPAFIDGEHAISYGEFDAMVDRTAAWLEAQGIVVGDRVAVWLVNRMEWLALYFALGRIGAALMTVNTRYRSHELAYILERSQARMLVLQLNFRHIDFPAVLRDVDHAAARSLERVAVVDLQPGHLPPQILGRPTVSFELGALPEAGAVGRPAADADAVSILFTTSGTTSGPKLVMHTQGTVALHCQQVARAYGFEQDGTRLLGALPFCGVFGFNAAMAAFAAARPVVLMDTFEAAEAVRLIGRHRITHLFGSDEMYQRMLERTDAPQPFPSVRVAGFAAFRPGAGEVAQAAWARQLPMTGLYGSSEVQALFAMQQRSRAPAERIEAGGLPANPGAEVRIRDIDSGELLPPGRSGQIEIRAASRFIGYLNNPEATAKAIDADGFFRTGDVGYLRQDGTFVYQTRQGDAMRLGGFLVSPAEIEEVLRTVPGVADVQVVAVDIGQQPRAVAFVIAAPGAGIDEHAAIDAAARALAAFKVPARVWFVDSFPVTQSSNGTKIQRTKLREMAIERLA
jgi:fatty-acyl-CoA synthase